MASRLIRVAAGAAVLSLSLVSSWGPAATAHATSTKPLTFTVGTVQDVDSLNVTTGVLVIDYEIWNLTLPTLTDKAAADFKVTPGLAQSWESSADGLTWTYHLRPGAMWSDGQPLTADDVVYTITRSVTEQWANHFATTQNLTATATDDRTVVITSSVPDPKLPVMDVYIVPKHIYEKISADDLPTYQADDNVAGGPFRIAERKEGEFVRLEHNPSWWGTKPAMDGVVFQIFKTPETQYNAMLAGDIDAIDDVPPQIYADLVAGKVSNVTAIGGTQGSFSELAMNNMCPTGVSDADGHPALKDKTVRQAINWAIDRDLLVDKILNGTGVAGVGLSVSANPAFALKVPEDQRYRYNPDKASKLLDQAGWIDSNNDGVRDKDGVELKLRYFDRSVGATSTAITPFIVGWLKDVGIATSVETLDEDTLTARIGTGKYDLFQWGWTPYVDPDTMLSYFTTAQVTTDPSSPLYNDANWCNADYDTMYEQQKVELDPTKRAAIITKMLRLFYDEAPYAVLFTYDDLQAIRSDRWTNFVRQPAKTGPVLENNTSPGYLALKRAGGSSGGGSNVGLLAGVGVAGVAVVAAGLFSRRRRLGRADDRE